MGNYYLKAEDANGYIDDVLLDWLWVASYPHREIVLTSTQKTRIKQAEYIIEGHAM